MSIQCSDVPIQPYMASCASKPAHLKQIYLLIQHVVTGALEGVTHRCFLKGFDTKSIRGNTPKTKA